jgi:hypothetical protein
MIIITRFNYILQGKISKFHNCVCSIKCQKLLGLKPASGWDSESQKSESQTQYFTTIATSIILRLWSRILTI